MTESLASVQVGRRYATADRACAHRWHEGRLQLLLEDKVRDVHDHVTRQHRHGALGVRSGLVVKVGDPQKSDARPVCVESNHLLDAGLPADE